MYGIISTKQTEIIEHFVFLQSRTIYIGTAAIKKKKPKKTPLPPPNPENNVGIYYQNELAEILNIVYRGRGEGSMLC